MEREWNAIGTGMERVRTEGGSFGFGITHEDLAYSHQPVSGLVSVSYCPFSLLLALVLARAVRTARRDVIAYRQDRATTVAPTVGIVRHDGTAYGQDGSS